MTNDEIDTVLNACDTIKNIISKQVRREGRGSCDMCYHFMSPHCSKHNASPPADVIKTGCEDFAYCHIPF